MARRGENIYKRKDGRWEGRFKNGLKANGKTKYSSVYGKSYNEVRSLLAKRRSEIRASAVHCKMTFGEIAALWLENVKNTVKESTYLNYMCKLQKHILPSFGNTNYNKMTAKDLNDFVQMKLSENYSVKYVLDILNLIKSITRFAKRTYGYTDVAEFISIPKDRNTSKKTVLDTDEQKKLIAYLSENPTCSNVGILLSLMTGLRVGELCALKWADIDLENRVISVNKTMQRIKSLDGEKATKIVIDTPKSKNSVREIPIPEPLFELLKIIKSDEKNYFLTGKELYTEPRTMQYRFRAVLKKIGLPFVNFHALRHTFATNCAALGFDAKTLSELLGHSSVGVTLNCYVHSSMERKRECMRILSRQFSGQ